MHKKSKKNCEVKKRATNFRPFRSRKLSQPTKKQDCALIFTVKKILPFLE